MAPQGAGKVGARKGLKDCAMLVYESIFDLFSCLRLQGGVGHR
jgi:hypothetical protein